MEVDEETTVDVLAMACVNVDVAVLATMELEATSALK